MSLVAEREPRRAWLAQVRARLLPQGPEVAGFGIVLLCVAIALEPVFRDLHLYGGHDWDEMSAHRLLTVKALLEFGQLPLWMPYACGGFSEWGNVQGATNLVSPFLPFYLLLDLRHALRVELLGTTLISAVGTWLLAGGFTGSAPARALCCLVYVASGRFALQAATGHLWHLQYCYLPWVFWAFERCLEGDRPRLRHWLIGGGALASMVYGGGIYPLPHTALLLSVYAAARSLLDKNLKPVLALAAFGALSIGLSAPKLFAVALDFGERPRLVDSPEAIDWQVLWQALVAAGQTPSSRPVATPAWGWHEYGAYIGWSPALLLALGTLWWAPRREQALKLAGLVALALSFGAFHELAPWSLLHRVGPFRSQHVPTRWLYPALLLLGVATAAAFGRAVERLSWKRHAELLLLGGCLWIAVDIGRESAHPLERAFWMSARPVRPAPEFVQYERVPKSLQYKRRDYAPEAVPAVLSGIGVISCTMQASLNIWAPKAENGRPFGMGAWGREHPRYRGEAYLEAGPGTARLVRFSPNELTVEVSGARAGDRLIVNQNFDPGWHVNGASAEKRGDALAMTLPAGTGRFVFTFWPRGASAGLVVLGITLAGVALIYARRAKAATLRP